MFVHLHNHSDYSLQKSVSTVEGIVKHAKQLQQPAVAITDNGNLFAVAEFAKICKSEEIKAIYGCEFNLVQNIQEKVKYETGSIILLCINDIGFNNLTKLSSLAYIEGFYYQPRIDYHILTEHNEGLLCIVPQDNSLLSHYLELGKENDAKQEIVRIKDIFNDRVYLEIQNHGLSLENQINQKIAKLGKEWETPLVAGNNSHYVSQQDSQLHEIFVNIEAKGRNRNSLSNDQYYIKDYDEMKLAFKDFPEAVENTMHIANRCEFTFTFRDPELPSFPLPSNFTNENDYLRHLTQEGIKTRYSDISEEIIERVNFELDVIISMKFSGYFLIVWDIIAFAHRSDIPVGLGRGSVAGSIVAYALRITDIDPLKFGLLFERFLNPERISMPDIDTDFCFERRQEIIEYIKSRYGTGHVGQIITFSQLKPRGAIRDAARSLNIPLEIADEIAKLIPLKCLTLEEAEAQEPKLKLYHQEKYKELFDTTTKLIGLHRHASIHAAGIVIGTKELTKYVPLYRDIKSGAIATQYTMNYLEQCGLVKMDILGLRTLTIIKNAVTLIQKENPDFSIDTIDEQDSKVYSMLSKGDGDSVFQFESSGMKRLLKDTKPKQLDDLIALNALYRPGPMRFIDDYTKIRAGKAQPTYGHEVLKPILENTYGIILYQEQVMDIARKVGGFSLAGADILRRNMGKKEAEAMEKQRPIFVNGAIEQGFTKEEANNIFSKITPFAQYGFNKSHSAAYATLAYQTAFLKSHYPVQYMMACISANFNKQDELTKVLRLCKKLGIAILPPDINKSYYEFSIEQGHIRYGFCAIKDVSEEYKRHLPEERAANGPYTSILDSIERFPTHRSLLSFIKIAISVGLYDSFDNRRTLLYSNANNIYLEGRKRMVARQEKQMLLFTEETDYNNTLTSLDKLPQEALTQLRTQLIDDERNFLGIHLVQNPLDPYKKLWLAHTTIKLHNLMRYIKKRSETETQILIAYIDDFTRIVNIKNNRKTFFGTMEDYNGSVAFELYTDINDEKIELTKRTVYGMIGQVVKLKQHSEAIFRIKEIFTPENLVKELAEIHRLKLEAMPHREIHLYLVQNVTPHTLQELKNTLLQYYGETKVVIYAQSKNNTLTKIALPAGFTIQAKDKALIESLENNPIISKIEKY